MLKLLVIGRATERTTLGELRCKLWSSRVLVGVRDVRVGLVDHRLQLWVVTDVLVRPNLRRRPHPGIRSRIYVELAIGDVLQCRALGVLALALSKRTLLGFLEGLHLPIIRTSNRRAVVLLVRLIVDCLRLIEIVRICVRQPRRKLDLARGGCVFRLSATAHDVAPLPCGISLPCITRHGGGRGIRKAVRPSIPIAVGRVCFRPDLPAMGRRLDELRS